MTMPKTMRGDCGEALGQAQEIPMALWTVTEDSKAILPDTPSYHDHPPPEYPAQRRSAPSSSSEPEIRKSWNTPQGGTQKQHDYQHVAERRCSFLKKGEPCLKWDHNAITHARWVADERRNSSQMTRGRSMKSFR